MPTFESQPQYEHGQPDALGVLVVNLGTPDAPTTTAVRRYLRQFLWDPRVVEYPRALWWLILNGVILVIRPSKSAHAYQQVWTERGSPLLFHSQDIAATMQTQLSAQLSGNVRVELAMTYGNPSIEVGLNKLHAAGARRIVVLPLYPQYSGATTASVFDAVSGAPVADAFVATSAWALDITYPFENLNRPTGAISDDQGGFSIVAAVVTDQGEPVGLWPPSSSRQWS